MLTCDTAFVVLHY